MGYYDKVLMHEDKRDKGMNSTSNEKGTDGKKNNTSEYNHNYYMKNKEKWQDNKSSGAKYSEYTDGDHDFDDANYSEKNRLGDTDFFGFQKPDGSWVILEEDMKWTVPAGMDKADMIKALESFSKDSGKLSAGEWSKKATEAINKASKKKTSSGEQEFDVDAAAKDVIRGKYGNGADRRAALGDDYAAVQKRVDEMMKSDSAKHSEEDDMYEDDEYEDQLEHHGIKGQKWGVRRFESKGGELTAAGRKRYQTLDGKYQKLKDAKAASKAASKNYGKDFDKANGTSVLRKVTKKGREEYDKRWEDAYNSAVNANKAASKYKQAKVDYKFQKKITKNEEAADKMMEMRAKNRAKLERKAEKVAHNLLKSEIMKAKIKDFDEGTKLVKAGYDRYSKTLSNYRDVKMKSIADSSYKQTDAYKTATKDYKLQNKSDRVYGKNGTRLQYAFAAGREKAMKEAQKDN